MTDKEYEKARTFRELSDEALESLRTMAEEGATASEMLKKVEQLKTCLEIVAEMEDK